MREAADVLVATVAMPPPKRNAHFINGAQPLFPNLSLLEGARPRPKPLRREPDSALRHLLAELVDARHRAGLCQRQVAERLRTTVSAISRLERGKRSRPTLSTLEHYAMVVGCRIEVHVRPR
jgi:DNA-binding XRE family transcriptional regulator